MLQENKIKLSIIIPVYNEQKFLVKLFQDIIKYFNNKDHEIIIVNDGSTDGSLETINSFKNHYKFKFKLIIINLEKNFGKGKAIKKGIQNSNGEYILLQDADLELDIKDCFEMYQMIKNESEIKCIFGSRYQSGKLKKNNNLLNTFLVKINTFIFNIFFSQSLSDVHCGLKVFHRDVVNKIKLTVNDFGIEIDIASQIARNKFNIYEFGVSYYFRTKAQGKKITWLDGVKSFLYLIKARYFDNSFSTNISIMYSSLFMSYVGTHFGMGLGKNLFIIFFFLLGSIIGINFKIGSSSIIFLFIYIGSFFGKGNGTSISILIFIIIGIYLAKINKQYFKDSKFKNFF